MDSDIYRIVEAHFTQALQCPRPSVTAFVKAREQVNTAVASAVSKYARIVNEVAAVNQLPVEILSRIFGNLDTADRIACTHACQYWRSAALDSPLLWQSLHIVVPPPPSQLSPSLATLFARSHQQPVAVHFAFPFETTHQLASRYSRELALNLQRVSDLRLVCPRARYIDALKCIVTLLGDLSSDHLRSLEFELDIDRTVPDPVILIPILDHLPVLDVLSVSGDLEWNLAGLVHRLKILRLPDPELILDEPEVSALVEAIVKGTTLEQLEINGNDLYEALRNWFESNSSGDGTRVWPVQSNARLRYIRWPRNAIRGPADFADIRTLVRARSMLPMTMVLDVHRLPPETLWGIILECEEYLAQNRHTHNAVDIEDPQEIGHEVLVIPHSTNDRLAHVSLSGSNRERWILPCCPLHVFNAIDGWIPGIFDRVTSLAAHETCWRFNLPDSPCLRHLTIFLDPTPVLFSIPAPFISDSNLEEGNVEDGASDISRTPSTVERRCLVPQLQTLTLAQLNRSRPVRRTAPLSDTLHVDVTLESGILKPVPVRISEVDNLVQTRLNGAVLPLQRLVLRDVVTSAEDGAPASYECASSVVVESTGGVPPSAKVPFVFCHDPEVAWMYCIRD